VSVINIIRLFRSGFRINQGQRTVIQRYRRSGLVKDDVRSVPDVLCAAYAVTKSVRSVGIICICDEIKRVAYLSAEKVICSFYFLNKDSNNQARNFGLYNILSAY
jgi:hypothetical protein